MDYETNLIKNIVPVDDEIIQNYMPHYGIYKRKRKKVVFFCTHCMQWLTTESSEIKHKQMSECIGCREQITFLAEGIGRSAISEKRNFLKFDVVNENEVVAAYYRLRSTFSAKAGYDFSPLEDGTLDYSVDLIGGYYLAPGIAHKYLRSWDYETRKEVWRPSGIRNEPNFSPGIFGFGYSDNTYTVISDYDLNNTFLRYAYNAVLKTGTNHFMRALTDLVLHPNLEYLINGGFIQLFVDRESEKTTGFRINFRSNDLKKMLGMNKNEIKYLQGIRGKDFDMYKFLKKSLKTTMQETYDIIRYYNPGYVMTIHSKTGLSYSSIIDYCHHERTVMSDWHDYILQCEKLNLDLSDTSISKPKNLTQAHERTTAQIQIMKNQMWEKKVLERYNDIAGYLSFETEELKIVVPHSSMQIINEGKMLHHCVGSYVERHADGKLSIVFLRQKSDPTTPYYTIEVSNEGDIVQCRGYRNNNADNPKTDDIRSFEKEYQKYLDENYKKFIKKRKSA